MQMKEYEGEIGEVWMCQINSGYFKVKWEDTKKVLEGVEVEGGMEVTVVNKD